MAFSDLGLSDKVLAAVTAAGYTTPTPIQEQAIPHVLARRDVLGIAQTGSGLAGAGLGDAENVSARPDRHRQDRCLRPAHAYHAGKGPRPRPNAPHPDSGADARTRRPG